FCSLRAFHGSHILFTGPSQVFVSNGIKLGTGAVLAPAGPPSSPAVSPSDVNLFVRAGAVDLSLLDRVSLALCAPDVALALQNKAPLTGRFVAGSAHVGRGVTVGIPGPPSSTTTTTSTSTSLTSSTSSSSSSLPGNTTTSTSTSSSSSTTHVSTSTTTTTSN